MHPGPVARAIAKVTLSEIVMCSPLCKAWAGMTEYKQWRFLSGLEWEIAQSIGDLHEDPKPDLKVVPIKRESEQNLHDEDGGA
jgi:hypothetical protein